VTWQPAYFEGDPGGFSGSTTRDAAEHRARE